MEKGEEEATRLAGEVEELVTAEMAVMFANDESPPSDPDSPSLRVPDCIPLASPPAPPLPITAG